jgi:hypothetical protein
MTICSTTLMESFAHELYFVFRLAIPLFVKVWSILATEQGLSAGNDWGQRGSTMLQPWLAASNEFLHNHYTQTC